MSPIYTANVVHNSSEILPKILEIYLPDGGLIADLTYGNGTFWKRVKMNQPGLFEASGYLVVSSDLLNPTAAVRADARCTPYRDESFDAVIFDPPWGATSTTQNRKFMGSRYKLRSIPFKELRHFLSDVLIEMRRIVRSTGFLLIKGQDFVTWHKRHFLSCELWHMALKLGLLPEDMMISVQATPMPQSWNVIEQRHFQSNHCWYWIFRKPNRSSRSGQRRKDCSRC